MKQSIDSPSKNTGNSPVRSETIREKTDNRQRLVIEYEFSQKMFKNIYSKGHKDVYVQLCLNNQLITELDPSACGDLGRVKGRRGKLQIEFDRLKTGEPESAYLYAVSLEKEKPPVGKWVLKSFLSPHWGHKQMEAFNKPEDLPPQNASIEAIDTLSTKKTKKKKRKTAIIISGLLVVGGLIKLTSIADYQMAKEHYDKGDVSRGRELYKQANQGHRAAIVFAGAALLVDLGNVVSVFSKGNKKRRDYYKNKPKGQKCTDW